MTTNIDFTLTKKFEEDLDLDEKQEVNREEFMFEECCESTEIDVSDELDEILMGVHDAPFYIHA